MISPARSWFGKVPSGWAVCPVGYRYEVQLGKMLNPDAVKGTHLAPYLRNTDVQWGTVNTTALPEMSFDAREQAKFALRPGDLLVCEGGDVGRTAIWKGELRTCFYQKAIQRLRPWRQTEDPRFFYYAMTAAAWRGVFTAEGNKNTIAHLTAEKLRGQHFPFPPVREQRAIADFLDHATTTLNSVMARKESIVAALGERRRAAVASILFRGTDALDEGVAALNRSGARLPRGWCIKPAWVVLHPVKEQNWGMLSLLSVYRDLGVVPKDSRDDNYNRPGEDLSVYQRVLAGDVVVNKMKAWQGSVAVSSLTGIVSPDYQVLRPVAGSFIPAFLHHLLRSPPYVAEYARRAYGVRPDQWRLMWQDLRSVPLLIPPLVEQQEMATAMDAWFRRDDGAATALEAQLAALKEYRQALITAAVTGQLDVASQPQEAA